MWTPNRFRGTYNVRFKVKTCEEYPNLSEFESSLFALSGKKVILKIKIRRFCGIAGIFFFQKKNAGCSRFGCIHIGF